MEAVLYADDDEDDDADFRFTVMVKEAEIVAELADLRFAQRFCKILRGGLRRVGSRTNLLRIAAVGERIKKSRVSHSDSDFSHLCISYRVCEVYDLGPGDGGGHPTPNLPYLYN